MDRIACMQSFVRAIELNSFSAVAREQQTTQPTISKQIAALENYLGAVFKLIVLLLFEQQCYRVWGLR